LSEFIQTAGGKENTVPIGDFYIIRKCIFNKGLI